MIILSLPCDPISILTVDRFLYLLSFSYLKTAKGIYLDILGKFAQMKAMAFEEAENNKLQVAVGPLIVTPAFLTVPASSYGKKF